MLLQTALGREVSTTGAVCNLWCLFFRYLSADVGPGVINAVIAALADNTLVEALYIQNFERVRGPSAGQELADVRVVNDAMLFILFSFLFHFLSRIWMQHSPIWPLNRFELRWRSCAGVWR